MQVVYHGSSDIVIEPRIIKGRFNKDFGDGFYCTILEEQTKKWARKYDKGIVNIYEYRENNSLNIKNFPVMTEEWLDFIIDCRSGKKHNYDIVIGSMADDQVYNYISDLINGVITRDAFWELAKFKHPTHQIAFCTEESLKCIKFINYEEL